MVLVDTSVWSLLLRRRRASLSRDEVRIREALGALLGQKKCRIAGPIRQELLTGIRDLNQYELLRTHLRALPDATLDEGDYEEAAAISNRCRSRGVATTPTDCLLVAVAARREWELFTRDKDFDAINRVVPLKLYRL